MVESTVHTMPLEELRARAREAQRLIAQAREIARISFDAEDEGAPPSSDGTDASRQVGLLLDAAQRLLPGMTSLSEERAFAPRSPRAKQSDSGLRRVTLRAGADRALESIERAAILDAIASNATGLIAEIERRSSSVLRAADVAPERERVRRGS